MRPAIIWRPHFAAFSPSGRRGHQPETQSLKGNNPQPTVALDGRRGKDGLLGLISGLFGHKEYQRGILLLLQSRRRGIQTHPRLTRSRPA